VSSRRLSAGGTLAVAGVILGSAAVGFFLHRLTTRAVPVLAAATAPAIPASQQAGADRAAAPRRRIPDELPDFSLPGTDGLSHRLADWRGRPLIVNFWATWCEPCRREIPLLKQIRRENAPKNLEIVGIAIDHRDSVEKYAGELGVDYPLLLGDRGGLEAASAFGMDLVLPFSVFADSRGRIVTLKLGELHRDEAAVILGRLADLEAGQLSLADARAQIGEEIRRLAASRRGAGESGGE
jgi:thiol-disulfide isomerase/thioredoxin